LINIKFGMHWLTTIECDRSFTRSDALAKHMRTVHETEALRPSDPVPKHHSSNPINKSQRLKLVFSEAKRSADKGSTPASPSPHPPNSANLPPSGGEAEYANNNITYIQDLSVPNAPHMVQFPPDINFTPYELSLPANELFQVLRHQLHWATEEGESLRREAEALEKQRKDEWAAKELLLENVMESTLATGQRQLLDAGLTDRPPHLVPLEHDVQPSKNLHISPKDGRLPWWREESWLIHMKDRMDPRGAISLADVRPDDVVVTAEA
jgi:hypothetical protein